MMPSCKHADPVISYLCYYFSSLPFILHLPKLSPSVYSVSQKCLKFDRL